MVKSLHLVAIAILLVVQKPRDCHSFLSPTARNPPRTRSTRGRASDGVVLAVAQRPPEFSFSRWSRENYLRLHQKVNRRKAFARLLEITRVLAGRVLQPLVCNLVQHPPLLRQQQTWDDFWERKSPRGPWSNAERVALGLPSLGPTFVKLGQALATRPDILHVPLAEALANLQDSMSPFDNLTAKRIIRQDFQAAVRQRDSGARRYFPDKKHLKLFLKSLSDQPVAAASIAQVYKAYLPGFGPVAVKVRRPGIDFKVERDATLFHSVAAWFENLKWARGTPLQGQPLLGQMKITQTVDEFMSRVFEEMDFENEVQNMQLFGKLYDHRLEEGSSSGPERVQVMVPRAFPELSSRRVIVMEWLEGTKLTDMNCLEDCESLREENLRLVEKAIECTLSQVFEKGVLHADPHTGNLLKTKTASGQVELGYLDFGLVSHVPQRFRDGIVCAVVQIVFARNIEAVVDLCVDIGLLSEDEMKIPEERQKLLEALQTAFDNILVWPKDKKGRATALPKVRFQNLLTCLAIIITNFEFTVPPYFLNNARALATLEGIAVQIDPDFNILRVIYPYAINHLFRSPTVSRKAQETFLDICRNPDTKLVDLRRFRVLLNDWALLTGYTKRRVFWDLLTSRGGRHVSIRIAQEWYLKRYRQVKQFPRHLGHMWQALRWEVANRNVLALPLT